MNRRLALAAVCGMVLAPAACDGGGNPDRAITVTLPPSQPTATATLCGDAAAVRSALDVLRNLTVAPGLVDEVRTAAANLRSSVSTLVDDLRGRLQSEAAAVQASLATLRGAIDDLVASPGPDTVTAARTALTEVTTATQRLLSALDRDCPATSPSPGR